MGQIDVESTLQDDPLISTYKSPSEIDSPILPKWLVFWAVAEGYRLQGYSSRKFGIYDEDENAIIDAERAYHRVMFIWQEQIGVDYQTTGVVANTTTPWRWFTPEKVAAKPDHSALAHFVRCCWAWAAMVKPRAPVVGVQRFTERHICPNCNTFVHIEFDGSSTASAEELPNLCDAQCALIPADTDGQEPLRVGLWPD